MRAQRSARGGWAALSALLAGTFLGTVNNNIVNVPLRSIALDFGAPLSRAVLVVIGFLLVFSVTMPLTGWLGDRLGRRRVYTWALVGLAVGALGAATAPSLGVLIFFRVLQGASTAAVLPAVMGLITEIFEPGRRARAIGMWAAVNGIGQAVGPPVGGFLADWLGWRWIFVPLIPLSLLALAATLLVVPRDHGRAVALDARGAVTLTLGATLVIAAATAVPHSNMSRSVPAVLGAAGIGVLALFGWLAGRGSQPFIPRHLMLESRFLRSCLAAFAQMFSLGATLVAVPLYLTGQVGLSAAAAGVVVFALPAAMSVLAPVTGFTMERLGPRPVIRSGLALLIVTELALGSYLAGDRYSTWLVVVLLACCGVGVALIQTPAATGATRSPAGQVGAAIGLFNLIRFAGSALGAAWVAIVLPHGALFLLFAVCSAVALAGLVGTFAGPDPEPVGASFTEPPVTTSA